MKENIYPEINRDSFGTSTVIALLKSNALNKQEALRLLEEAIHVIIRLRTTLRECNAKTKEE